MSSPYQPHRLRSRLTGFTLGELIVVLTVLGVLALIAFLLFGRVRDNAVIRVCRTSADALARNARMIAAEDGTVMASHLGAAFSESAYPAGSSWDPVDLVVVHATPDGNCRVQFSLVSGDVVVGEPEAVTAFSDPSAGPAPAPPTAIDAVPGDRSVTLTWAASPEPTLAGHQVETCVVGGSCTVSVGGVWSAVIGGLSNGTSYVFRVAAVDDDSVVGAYSPGTGVVVPRTVPDAPAPPTVDVDGTDVEVTVVPGADNGDPIVENVATCTSPDGGSTVVATAPAGGPVVVTGLTPPPDASSPVTYSCTVRSRNDAGDSPESPPSDTFVTSGVPAAPRDVAVTAGDAAATLSWDPPLFDGGSPVSGYLVEQDDGLFWEAVANLDASATGVSVSGLVNGATYRFRVTAENAIGWGAVSVDVSVVPYGVPAVPGALAASPGDGQVELSWTAPAGNGRPVTDYVVEYASNVAGPWTVFDDGVSSAATTTVTGLANGTEYTFRVAAVNLRGSSSPASASARPVAPPSAPLLLSAAPGTGSEYDRLTVTWSPPSSDGGAGALTYTLEVSVDPAFSSVTAHPLATSPRTLTGLAANTTYHVRVRAANDTASGPWSSVSALTVPAAPSLTLTCPQGYTAAGAQANALTNSCTVATSTVSGATVDGVVAGPGGYSKTFTSASYEAVDVPLANLSSDPVMANARLCNSSGCGPYAVYLGVASSSVPRPGTPIVTVGECAFGHCFVYFSATHAWTYEVNVWGGPSSGVLRCYNVACADGAGAWPVGFDGSNYYTERANSSSSTRTLHVTDSCGGLGGCARAMLVPQGSWVRVSGTNGFASGAPAGWPNSGWCVPAGGEPFAASCNWSNGPGVAEFRAGYVYVG